MVSSLVEHQIENAVDDLFDEKTARVVKGVGKMAVKHVGKAANQGHHFLTKRPLAVLGGVIVGVQIVTAVTTIIVLRKTEDQRIERVVRAVLKEEHRMEKAEKQQVSL